MKRPLAVRRRRVVWLGLGGVLLVGVAIALLEGGGRGHRPAVPGAGAAAGPPAAAPPSTPLQGINVNRLFLDRAYSPAQIDAQLSALEQTGATDARCDALWEATEPAPPTGGVHHYNWSFDDQVAGSLARHRLRWLPIIDYSAPWAQSIPGQDHSAPSSPAAYAGYAGAFAERYGPGGSFWAAHPAISAQPVTTIEIWNEPDGAQFWVPGPDPRAYANLYASARAAIKAADPAARVLIGGLTNLPVFLPAIIAARPDLRGRIDGVGVHPYLASPPQIIGAMRTDRTVLRALGLANVPLYVTEFGWTVRPRGTLHWLPGPLRPSYISDSFQALAHTDCGIAAVFLYTWVTPQQDAANGEDWFGINPPQGGSSPSTRAFAAGIRLATRAQAPLPVCGATD
jgi:hypothetical protein